MTEDETRYLVWPRGLRTPDVDLPSGYALRAYQDGDRDTLERLLGAAGCDVDDGARQKYLDHALPNGLFFAVERETGDAVGLSSALHNPAGPDYRFPFGGEAGGVYVDPAHRRLGLGRALAAATVRRFDDAGYGRIWAEAGDDPALLRLYLDMGFKPFLQRPAVVGRWRDAFDDLDLPFDPARCVEPPLR